MPTLPPSKPEGEAPTVARITLTALILGLATLIASHLVAAQLSNRIVGVVWADTNCDGIRQDSETLLPNARLTLRWAGSNGVIDATDRDIEQTDAITGAYAFSLAGAGEPYFIAFRNEDKPAGMTPAPFRQSSDTTRDNDLTTPLAGTSLWATPVFPMPADGATVTGLDIGLCTVQFDPAYSVRLPLIAR